MKQIFQRPAVLFVCTLLFGLAACTKPLPSITIQSGTKSVHSQALCWNESDENKLRDCLTSLATNPNLSGTSINASSGSPVGMSLDPKATEYGWQALVNGAPLFSVPKTTTYYRFEVPPANGASATSLQIVAFGPSNSIRGVWLFKLNQ